jgi:hypothetical protein
LPSPEEVESEYDSSPINSLGLFEADGTYNESDMNQFFERFSPYVPVGTEPIPAPINGAKIQQGKYHPFTNGETELDLQIMYPIVYPQTITLYQISPKHYEDTFLGFPLAIQDFLDAIDASFCNIEPPNQGHDCGIYVPRRVISMSYGVSELVQPEKYVVRLCNEFLKLGLQGTTFTISSGDYGVAAQYAAPIFKFDEAYPKICTNNSSPCFSDQVKKFLPSRLVTVASSLAVIIRRCLDTNIMTRKESMELSFKANSRRHVPISLRLAPRGMSTLSKGVYHAFDVLGRFVDFVEQPLS